jgi:probable addiction module antidote protein
MTRKTKVPTRSHEEATIESFHKNPKLAAAYLNAVLDDGDQQELLLALRRLSEAHGGVTQIAADAKLNSTTLYRTLSAKGNSELRSFTALLKAMGMRLAVKPVGKAS